MELEIKNLNTRFLKIESLQNLSYFKDSKSKLNKLPLSILKFQNIKQSLKSNNLIEDNEKLSVNNN